MAEKLYVRTPFKGNEYRVCVEETDECKAIFFNVEDANEYIKGLIEFQQIDDALLYGFSSTLYERICADIKNEADKDGFLAGARRVEIRQNLFRGVPEHITWPVQQRLYRSGVVK
ncbi:MAG: hypothetical protein PQJ59_16455 [Spirochaetales bacterium]|nr:hypothetical protein [Spirochaetales bacterium]